MKPKLILYIIPAITLFLVITGCGGGGPTPPPGGGSGETEWTIMVFVNADNNLEPFSIDSVNQMEKIGSSGRVKIVVQWDRTPGFSTAADDWTSTRRYEIVRDSGTDAINSRLIEDLGELNMGSPQVLKDFISWAQQNYPAKRYCLVIWNHGSGWRSINRDRWAATRDISYDATSDSIIHTWELPDILTSAPTPIDLMAMDACLMEMIEVAYEIKGAAGYLVGSEGSQPGQGYIYDMWLAPLTANPAMDAASLGRMIAEQFVQAYKGDPLIVQSVVDLNKVAAVATALDGFAGELLLLVRSYPSELKSARETALVYSADDGYLDLQDYAYKVVQLIGDYRLNSAYSDLVTAIGEAVVYVGYGGGDMANSHGLSVWVPDPTLYSSYAATYQALQLPLDTRWDEFLASQQQ